MMTSRPLRRRGGKSPLHSEDLDAAIANVMEAMQHEREEAAAYWKESRAQHNLPPLPDMSNLAEDALRTHLEDEIVELEPVQNSGIREDEIQREVIKKALVGLKMPALRAVALSRDVPVSGKAEEIARRVASSYAWDETAIAQLVLDQNQEPTETKNGVSTRVFVLREPADLKAIEQRFAFASGRYVRSGVARWFVFENYQRLSETALELQGSLRTYQPHIDDEAGEASLRTLRKRHDARLEITAGSRFLMVHDASSTAAKAMVDAFRVIGAGETLPYVPGSEIEAEGLRETLHPSTLFLLDLLTSRLHGHLFKQRNPVLARFRLARTEANTGESAPVSKRRPRLSAVRFAGDNLLDSPSTCRLMWADSRPLVDLTLRVAVVEGEDEPFHAKFPVRIAVENSHVLVATGLGTGESVRAPEVQHAAVAAVIDQIDSGVTDERKNHLTDFIRMQAQSSEAEAEARLLDDV